MKIAILLCPLLAAILLAGDLVAAGEKGNVDKQTKEDVAAVKAFLEKTRPGKVWGAGPTRMDSAEIRQAYPGHRFYFVWSRVPVPRAYGTQPPAGVLEAERKAYKEIMEAYISSTVRIDPQGKVSALVATKDFADGLMPVASEAEMQITAAAMVSLKPESDCPGHIPPVALAAKAVKVVKTDKGWTCSLPLGKSKPRDSFEGIYGGEGVVIFTADASRVVEVARRMRLVDQPPGPPSAPPPPKK